jgi:acyl dehydratase
MSLLVDTVRTQVGRMTGPYILRAEVGDLIRFATMLGYTQPWYVDEAAARRSRFGGIIAVPTYLIVMRNLEHQAFAKTGVQPPSDKGVDGGSAWTYFEPIRAGDSITAVAKITGFDERETRLGRTVFQRIDSEYRNQFGQLVARQHDTRIYYE